jgi:ParB family transcriptional regulator, chromosome partitioning protein
LPALRGAGGPGDARAHGRLQERHTAQRTLALQERLAAEPATGIAAVAHALALQTFYGPTYDPDTCLGLELKQTTLQRAEPAIEESRAGQGLAQRHEHWAQKLPRDSGELWDWILAQDFSTRRRLLIYCAARTLDAVHYSWQEGSRGLRHAQLLAEALALDMAEWWEPTRESYLAHVSKARILQAVREGVSEEAAGRLAGLKKDAMIDEAERLLKGSRWLPELLRAKPQPAAEHTAAAE